jgi:hypothetical protein
LAKQAQLQKLAKGPVLCLAQAIGLVRVAVIAKQGNLQ